MYGFKKVSIAFLIVIFTNITNVSFSQSAQKSSDTSAFVINEGDKLLYYVNTSITNNNEFLIPFIESELKNLRHKNATSSNPLLKDVQSLNLYLAGLETNNTLLNAINRFDLNQSRFNKINKEQLETQKSIVKRLQENQFFLTVNINPFNSLIEYQFILYKIDTTGKEVIHYLKLPYYRTTSVFIDPNNPDYKDKIKAALRQVIFEANKAPIPFVMLHNKKITDTVFVERGHITLTATAEDEDSSPEQLTYKWEATQEDSAYIDRQVGKTFDIYLEGKFVLDMALSVNDGVNTNLQKFVLVVNDKPFVSIQTPSDYENTDYTTNTYRLYSYHRFFKLGDFSGVFNIQDIVAKKGLKNNNYQNWSLLIPEIRVITTAAEKDQIVFSNIKFKIKEDTLIDYQDKIIPPLLSHANIPLPIFDNLGSFRQNLDSIIRYNPETYPGLFYYAHIYALYLTSNSTQSIKMPTTQSFRVTAINHDSKNSEDFQIQFHKVSRVSLFSEETLYCGLQKLNNHYRNYISLGVGMEVIILPELSLQASGGLLRPTSSDTLYLNNHSSPSYYYKINANLCALDFKNKVKFFLTLTRLYRETFTYSHNYIISQNYYSRPGFGFTVQGRPCTAYHFEQLELGLIFLYYPKTDNLMSGNIEMGLKVKLNFKK